MIKVKEDLTNKQFKRLTVIKQIEDYVASNGKRYAKWLCECECGNRVEVLGNSLKTGNTQSCGCLHWEIATSTFWICFAGVFCIVGILLWIFDVVYWDEFIGTMFGIVIIVVAVFTIGTQAYDIITCKYFPELQIIEYIKHLSNTVK